MEHWLIALRPSIRVALPLLSRIIEKILQIYLDAEDNFMPPVLELRGITKQFPGVLANDNVNLTLEKGEIHALLGENGAGKTTLMNILYGLYKPTNGEIFINDNKVDITAPTDAIRQGIGNPFRRESAEGYCGPRIFSA